MKNTKPLSKPEVFEKVNTINVGKFEIKITSTKAYESTGFAKAGLVGIVYAPTKYFTNKKRWGFKYEPCYITDELVVEGCSLEFVRAKRKLMATCSKWVFDALGGNETVNWK